jgi:hypothetical protein
LLKRGVEGSIKTKQPLYIYIYIYIYIEREREREVVLVGILICLKEEETRKKE